MKQPNGQSLTYWLLGSFMVANTADALAMAVGFSQGLTEANTGLAAVMVAFGPVAGAGVEAKAENRCVKASGGRRTRTVILLKDGIVVLSAHIPKWFMKQLKWVSPSV